MKLVQMCQHVADDLLNRLDTKFPNSNLLRRMIEEGNLGKKSGQGFTNIVKANQMVRVMYQEIQHSDCNVKMKKLWTD